MEGLLLLLLLLLPQLLLAAGYASLKCVLQWNFVKLFSRESAQVIAIKGDKWWERWRGREGDLLTGKKTLVTCFSMPEMLLLTSDVNKCRVLVNIPSVHWNPVSQDEPVSFRSSEIPQSTLYTERW